MITILGVAEKSNYKLIPGLDLWNAKRDMRNFKGSNKVIAHPPCAQWSRFRSFARSNIAEKDLAFFCLNIVHKNGGIFEHPAGSCFFKVANINMKRVISVDQSWWGFPARKRTYLYYVHCAPCQTPLSFNAIESKVCDLHSSSRSIMPLSFCQFLINSL
jgi:hypothetical protein